MNVQQLADAVAKLDATDALPCKLSVEEWKLVAPYLTVRFLRAGETLMRADDCERELYILAEGELEVRAQEHVLGLLGPGSVVGEGTFFSGLPRSASVISSQASVVWGLPWSRFDALANKHPLLAVTLVKGFAEVLAIRMREAVLIGNFS